MLISIAYIVISLAGLYFGAGLLVRGAASIAERLGVSSLVVGLTVVAFGTSTPELIVSVQASLQGFGAMSIGNIVGSNIVNIGVILGVSAMIYPLTAHMQLIRFDTPIMILGAGLFIVFFLDQTIGRIEGLILLSALTAYTVFNVIKSRKEKQKEVLGEYDEGVPQISRHWALDVLFILGGLGLLMGGSHFLVKGAVELARMIGLSEAVIGLTIVAVGTSMPELATSIVAAVRKQPDIAIGNVIGSNIFNTFGILGVGALIKPIYGPDINLTDSLVMLGMSILLLPLIKSGVRLGRWEGALFFSIYVGYVVYLLK
jgi:cation:H+ antiporter